MPEDAATLQLAIGQSAPGDTIVLAAGTYPGGVLVPPEKHDLTIRGVDRNTVVLDGANRRKNGIVVHADGVSIVNLSAHDFTKNGLYWDGADRFRASYVTVWNVGEYGVYVEDGEHGRVDHAYVSGAARAAYYVGECRPCDATISQVVARLSAVGYSGTNATGVVIRDSTWDRNGAGIVPNTYANEALPPQARAEIVHNVVTNSGRARVPIKTALAGFIGIGIAIAGGNANAIAGNRVTGSERYGIAIFPTARLRRLRPGHTRAGAAVATARQHRVAEHRRRQRLGRPRAGRRRRQAQLLHCATARHARRLRVCRGRRVPARAPRATRPWPPSSPVPVRVMMLETIARRQPPSYTSMPTPPGAALDAVGTMTGR